MIIVFTTVPNVEDGESLAKKIVEARLAACVQVFPKMKSFYFWEGKVQNDEEHLLLIKTLQSKFAALSEFIKSNHNYETPEIVAINSSEVDDHYLKWMKGYLD
jgi:periplasmic divalent cation tolerance protein